MSKQFETIVVGTGGLGSSCLYRLARRGVRVLGLDRFASGHDRGSSHGDTRIIRQAYFEHPDYVPLLRRAYDLWRDLESSSSSELMRICGLFMSGLPAGEAVAGTRLAAETHSLEVQNFSSEELASGAGLRFPGFHIPDDFEVVVEPAGGYLHVEDCVRAQNQLACQAGAVHRTDDAIVAWESDGETVRVRTASEEYEAATLILAPGAWASDLLGSIPGLPELRVLRKTLHWHEVRSNVYDVDNRGSGFLFEMPYGTFYGFPSLDGETLKVAEHTGGEPVSDPLQIDRSLRDSDTQPISRFLGEVMPDVDPISDRHSVCMYTVTPDGNLVVDRHSEYKNVFFGAGFSGHGFKLTSVLGEALADLAINGRTDLPIDFLSLARFAA
jgi:sarcosine oxidase